MKITELKLMRFLSLNSNVTSSLIVNLISDVEILKRSIQMTVGYR